MTLFRVSDFDKLFPNAESVAEEEAEPAEDETEGVPTEDTSVLLPENLDRPIESLPIPEGE